MGKFITFEGPDGCGKTSVIRLVTEKLKEDGYDFICTREPGGGSIAEKIRNVILDVENTNMDKMTESLLYTASRNQHLHDVVLPNLNKGKIVICDRFVDSAYAYQGIARGVGLKKVMLMNEIVVKNNMPDLTIFIDITPEKSLERIKRNSREENRLDLESIEFHNKVYEGYMIVADLFKDRIVKINGDQSLDDVVKDTYKVIIDFLKGK